MIMEGRSWHQAAKEKGARIVPRMRRGYSYLYQLYTTCFAEFDTLEEANSFRKFADENLPYWDYDPVATVDGTDEECVQRWKNLFYNESEPAEDEEDL